MQSTVNFGINLLILKRQLSQTATLVNIHSPQFNQYLPFINRQERPSHHVAFYSYFVYFFDELEAILRDEDGPPLVAKQVILSSSFVLILKFDGSIKAIAENEQFCPILIFAKSVSA